MPALTRPARPALCIAEACETLVMTRDAKNQMLLLQETANAYDSLFVYNFAAHGTGTPDLMSRNLYIIHTLHTSTCTY